MCVTVMIDFILCMIVTVRVLISFNFFFKKKHLMSCNSQTVIHSFEGHNQVVFNIFLDLCNHEYNQLKKFSSP